MTTEVTASDTTPNKGGRPTTHPYGALDDSYNFRTWERLKRRFLAVAGPSEINQFMAWYIGDGELPERPCDRQAA